MLLQFVPLWSLFQSIGTPLSILHSFSMLLPLRIRALFAASHHLPRPPLSTHSSSSSISLPHRLHFSRRSAVRVAPPLMASSPPPTLPPSTAPKSELYRGLEAVLGSKFSSDPLTPPPHPLIIVISGPSGVGKDAVIKKLQEVREGLHFVVTATSRAKRPGEVEGEDYYFVTKEQFLDMIERNELLEYALVYGEYKGIPKQQIREHMAMGYDVVLRVDIQGAETLRSIFGKSAVFIFLAAESEAALVKRLIDRKTETSDMLLVRVATAREEMKHVRDFDYVVVNEEGKLENAVRLVESIIDAEKARVDQRKLQI